VHTRERFAKPELIAEAILSRNRSQRNMIFFGFTILKELKHLPKRCFLLPPLLELSSSREGRISIVPADTNG
jgi:hypothetical protein